MTAYYNEIEPFAAQWLRNLIAAGHIAPGEVDTRSIVDVQPDDLKGFTQCHFFAGLGGWSLALRKAGWADDRPVWTGSCPCQPFSVAGKGKGSSDERHLWPEFARLIGERNPSVVFGEQVASKAGRTWLASVRADLEAMGYAVGAADLCAASVGAPHIRQRLWFVARSGSQGRSEVRQDATRGREGSSAEGLDERPLHGGVVGLADANERDQPRNARGSREGVHTPDERWRRPLETYRGVPLGFLADAQRGQQNADIERRYGAEAACDGQAGVSRGLGAPMHERAGAANTGRNGRTILESAGSSRSDGALSVLGHPNDARLEGRCLPDGGRAGERPARAPDGDAGRVLGDTDEQSSERRTGSVLASQTGEHGERERQHGRSAVRPPDASEGLVPPWADIAWLPCRDGKVRPTQPGLLPLAHGVSGRVGRLRAYGNAIVPQVAAEFVGAYLEVESGDPSESEGENLMSVLRNLGAAVEDNEEARNGL